MAVSGIDLKSGDRGISTGIAKNFRYGPYAEQVARQDAMHFYDLPLGLGAEGLGHVWDNYTAGTLVASETEEGGAAVLVGTTTAEEGGQLELPGSAVVPSANKKFGFECRVKTNSISAIDFFCGFAMAGQDVLSGGGIASGLTDWVGFYTSTTPGDIMFGAEVGGTAKLGTNVVLDIGETWSKLGFWMDGWDFPEAFVNGDRVDTGIPAPASSGSQGYVDNTLLIPMIAAAGPGTTAFNLIADWAVVYRQAQPA